MNFHVFNKNYFKLFLSSGLLSSLPNLAVGFCPMDFRSVGFCPSRLGSKVNGGTSVVFSLLEGEMSRIWYQNDQ